MKVSLRPFAENDLDSLQMWAEAIEAHRFMSRIHPHRSSQYPQTKGSLLAWYVIRADDQDIGVVWLEKKAVEDEIAMLGILIGRKDLLGHSIGEQAIKLALGMPRDEMSFTSVRVNVRESNTRGIHCYRNCGFVELLRGTKVVDGGIVLPFLTMELKLEQ